MTMQAATLDDHQHYHMIVRAVDCLSFVQSHHCGLDALACPCLNRLIVRVTWTGLPACIVLQIAETMLWTQPADAATTADDLQAKVRMRRR